MSDERKDQMQTACGLAETLSGTPIGEHVEAKPNGQQKDYVVLTADERAKGFVEPVRRSYVHEKCGSTTTMGQELAETYARCPDFYSGTFCCACRNHFPVGAKGEFVWKDNPTQKVGTRSSPADSAAPKKAVPSKTYLGDGCYVEHDGFAFVLTTENGIETTNRIVLEPSVYASLQRFIAALNPPRETPQ